MKYERLHGHIFSCIGCGSSGRWLWWWNRRNGMKAHFKRLCPKCGRRIKWKFLGNEINKINHGAKNPRISFMYLKKYGFFAVKNMWREK